MNKFNFYSLYFASQENKNKILKLRDKIFLNFELAKHNKHFSRGKTTKHRNGKREKKFSLLKVRKRKISYILRYQKIIEQMPEVLENIKKDDVKISLQEWLNM